MPEDISDHRARLQRSIGRSELHVGPDLGARVEVRVRIGQHDRENGEVSAKPQVAGGPDHQQRAIVGKPFLMGTLEHELARG